MAYDENVADRVRQVLKRRKHIVERKMFGGLAFMHLGNMCCGVIDQNLVLRLGEVGAEKALTEPCTRLMDFTGKPMKTMVYVSPEGYADSEDLKEWIQRALHFLKTLPAK